MHCSRSRAVRSMGWLSLGVAAALGSAGPAAATIPDAAGVFHGCHAAGTGALRLVEPETPCADGEASVTWGGAPAEPLRLQAVGHGGPLPANDWVDVPDAAVGVPQGTAACIASFTGFLLHHGGTTRAEARIILRTASDVLPLAAALTFFQAGDELPPGSVASVPFAMQSLFSPLDGDVTVVPQVLAADDTWIMGDPSVLLVSC